MGPTAGQKCPLNMFEAPDYLVHLDGIYMYIYGNASGEYLAVQRPGPEAGNKHN